jgi:flagellar motor switch protein FliN
MANNTELDLPDLGSEPVASGTPMNHLDGTKTAADLHTVFDVPVNIQAVLGKTALEVAQLLKLGPGSVIELDRRVGEAIDVYVNNRLVARGEIVVVEDRLGVTMTEIIKDADGS